jgi:transposase
MKSPGTRTSQRIPPPEIKGPGGSLPLGPHDEAVVDLVMLIEGETSGRNLDEVLGQFGRSRSTYYEKLRRFREQGVEGLLARPPGPRSPWRRPLEVVRFVVTTRLRNPGRTAVEIGEDLARLGHVVSVRSVERTLSQFGLTRPAVRQPTVRQPAIREPAVREAAVHEPAAEPLCPPETPGSGSGSEGTAG